MMIFEPQIDVNRANWDERVDCHLLAYDVDGFVADPRNRLPLHVSDLALAG